VGSFRLPVLPTDRGAGVCNSGMPELQTPAFSSPLPHAFSGEGAGDGGIDAGLVQYPSLPLRAAPSGSPSPIDAPSPPPAGSTPAPGKPSTSAAARCKYVSQTAPAAC